MRYFDADAFLGAVKTAALPAALANFVTKHHGALGGAGALGGVGALMGGVGGALHGAVQGHQEAVAEGDPGLRRVLRGALRGGAGGAGAGALAGAGLGAGLGVISPRAAEAVRAAATRAPLVGAGARFGQRQVHGVTGWTPGQTPESIRELGLGAHTAEKNLREARASGKRVPEATKGFEAARRAEAMGLTSIPGYIGALKEHGAKAIGTGLADSWHNMSPGWKAFSVGTAALPATTLLDSEATREEKARSLANVALSPLNMATGGLPMLMGNAVTGAMNRGVGHAVGALAR